MGKDGGHASEAELVVGLIKAAEGAEVREFGHDVAAAGDGEAGRIGEGFLNVLVGEMEVGATGKLERDANLGETRAQRCEEVLNSKRVIGIAVVGMGVQTMCVMPSAAAILAIATEVSMSGEPSSRPGSR